MSKAIVHIHAPQPDAERSEIKNIIDTAVKAERHACSIVVWLTLQDALADGAEDIGLDGWMREAERRVKSRHEGS